MIRNKKGFTLIELIVVIAIIGILVGLGAPKFIGYIQDAKLTTIVNDIVGVEKANDIFYIKYDKFAVIKGVVIKEEGTVAINKNKKIVEDITGFEKIDLSKEIGIGGGFNPSKKNKGDFIFNEITGEVLYIGKIKVSKNDENEQIVGKPLDKDEITELVALDFIPIANADELDRLRNEETGTFGFGTEWEGTYLAGLDKKYIQVANIDLSSFSNWDSFYADENGYFRGSFNGGKYTISNLTSNIGGLFAMNGGVLENINLVNIDVNVIDGVNIGGLVGRLIDNDFNAGAIIKDSSVTGKISSGNTIGGLVGYVDYGASVINSKANVIVLGDSEIGGLVGNSNGDINNSSASGSVMGNDKIGGLVGESDGLVTNSKASGNVTSEGEWKIGGLIGNSTGEVTNSSSSGNIIGNNSVGGLVGQNGGLITNSKSNGNVSGNNDIGGLVGYNYAEIIDSSASGIITGNDYVGGLIGQNYGDISNSHSTSKVLGMSQVGGLIGQNFNAIVDNSSATGNIEGKNNIGGFTGSNSGSITNSHAKGNVKGNNEDFNGVGGLVGWNQASIENSSASGTVIGNDYVGTLVGINTANIINSTAGGSASGTGENIGGLTGINYGEIN